MKPIEIDTHTNTKYRMRDPDLALEEGHQRQQEASAPCWVRNPREACSTIFQFGGTVRGTTLSTTKSAKVLRNPYGCHGGSLILLVTLLLRCKSFVKILPWHSKSGTQLHYLLSEKMLQGDKGRRPNLLWCSRTEEVPQHM